MLSNEQAKQEAIKKAWGESYDFDRLEKDIDENGIYHFTNINLLVSELEYISQKDGFRVKSLRGIEDNNGWIRIEPDGSNLPEKNPIVKYKVITKDGEISEAISWDVRCLFLQFKAVTHYKPITPELKPIY